MNEEPEQKDDTEWRKIIAAKDAEIERLRLRNIQAGTALADANKEIERLRDAKGVALGLAELKGYEAARKELIPLITELADALRKCKSSGWEYRSDFNAVELELRAREASKE